jgi:hypothetical protein
MYIAIVTLTMLVLPLASIAVEHSVHPDIALVTLAGRWFVFCPARAGGPAAVLSARLHRARDFSRHKR